MRDKTIYSGIVLVLMIFLASYVGAYDPLTWFLETLPVMLALPLLAWGFRRWRLTSLLLALAALHSLILIYGGHYTYARVPLGFWLQDWFGFERNHYDRLGHFMQGLVPAIITREILLRHVAAIPRWLLTVLCICVPLAVSALYEILEMIAGRVSAEAAEAFLGTQGDVWDSQMDMLLAGFGALSVFLLSRWHDRQLQSHEGKI
jgi:putative membrane protein